MAEYEIRLHKANDTLSIVMLTFAFSDRDAKAQAALMLQGEIAYAQVWCGEMPVGLVYDPASLLNQDVRDLQSLAAEMRRRSLPPVQDDEIQPAADAPRIAGGLFLRSVLR